jgi:serine/threonine protein kinase
MATVKSDNLAAGFPLGRYRILKALGAGGRGEVYLAEDVELERLAALKILPAEVANDAERVRRFVQEAKAASALNHPNILTIYEIGVKDNFRFIASEFIEGETLRQKLETRELSVAETLDIAVQIVAASDAAHRSGIVHRDIKPENVMIREDGLVKVLDFGIAKLTEKKSESVDSDAVTVVKTGTMPGMVIGTANYMSPEQARGLPVDVRTDIFSFGIVLYEMLSGAKPFPGETAMDIIGAILYKEPAPLSETAVPGELQLIVEKCLRKDRDERYESAKDLLDELKSLQKRLEFETELNQEGEKGRRGEEDKITKTQSSPHLLISSSPFLNSIAVLPFTNMSADAENEYFCDGLAEELLNALAKIDDLKVAARTSAFSFKNKNTNISKIGNILNVRTVLEGSVRKSGNRLRITVQLVNAANGFHLWSERYDREMQDIFDVQDEITLAVVDALKVKLLGEEKVALLKRYTDNTEAYQLYLRGRFFWNKFTFEDFQKSIDCFNQVLVLDPNYNLAYTGLSDAYVMLSGFGALSPLEAKPKAKAAALKALLLDDQLSNAHTSLGFILQDYDYDFAGAEREFKRAIKLQPGNSSARQFYGQLLTRLGRHKESSAEFRQALEIDPLSVVGNWVYGFSLFEARRYDEAIAQIKKVLELDVNFPPAYLSLAFIYQVQGEYAASVEEAAKFNEFVGNPQTAAVIRESFAEGGWQGFLRAMTGMRRPPDLPSYVAATFYAALGENSEAFDELNKAYENRESYLVMLKADPRLDSLRDDPRFQGLMRRVGLPQ